MIVADTSALVSLATVDLLDTLLAEFEVHTTETVVEELEDTAAYEDEHATAAAIVLQRTDRLSVHEPSTHEFRSSRVDAGEGSCAILASELDVDFLITDDLRALPELQTLSGTQVAISPIVLKALVKRDVLGRATAIEKLDRLAENRDWLGAPIYRRARELFE